MAELANQIQRIVEGLTRLRNDHGLDDVVVPVQEPAL